MKRGLRIRGLLLLAALLASLAEGAVASTCGPMAAMDMAEAPVADASGFTDGSPVSFTDAVPPHGSECDCPLGPFQGAGCQGAPSLRGSEPSVAGDVAVQVRRQTLEVLTPTLPPSDPLFHPPKA